MIQQFDFALLYLIQDIFKSGVMDQIMPLVTMLGNGGAFWIAVAAVLLTRRRTRQTGLMMCAAMLLCLIFGNLLLKNLIARPRPYALDQSIVLLIAPSSEAFSFPSGHTMNAFSAAFVLMLRRERFYGAALALAGLIAFSRVYLMMHFPLDIAGGIAAGFAAAWVSCRYLPALCEKLGRRTKQPPRRL